MKIKYTTLVIILTPFLSFAVFPRQDIEALDQSIREKMEK